MKKIPGPSTKNPLPKLLENIPEELTILSLSFSDILRSIVKEETEVVVSNEVLLVILNALAQRGFIMIHTIPSEEYGDTTIIKRL